MKKSKIGLLAIISFIIVITVAYISSKKLGQNTDWENADWNRIKEEVVNCNVKGGMQTHDGHVSVILKNGDRINAQARLDSIYRIVDDAREKCGDVGIMTE